MNNTTFNQWLTSLPEGRQERLCNDKFMLANAAFEAGLEAAQLQLQSDSLPLCGNCGENKQLVVCKKCLNELIANR